MESNWHKKIRKRIVEAFESQGLRVITAHPRRLNLFREEVKRENCLSDADIVVFGNGRIEKIIEIESEPNPKKMIGIIIATHLCNRLRAESNNYALRNIMLEIRYREPVPKSKKALKLGVIEESLQEMIKKVEGSVSHFSFNMEAR